MTASKPPSIKAIDTLKDIAIDDIKKRYMMDKYQSHPGPETEPVKTFWIARNKLVTDLSRKIEGELVQKYKEYGLESPKGCRSCVTDDKLVIELRMTKYPGIEAKQNAAAMEWKKYQDDLKNVEVWYLNCIMLVARRDPQIPVPPTPSV